MRLRLIATTAAAFAALAGLGACGLLEEDSAAPAEEATTETAAEDGTEIEVGLEYDENADTLTLTYPGEGSTYVHTRA